VVLQKVSNSEINSLFCFGYAGLATFWKKCDPFVMILEQKSIFIQNCGAAKKFLPK